MKTKKLVGISFNKEKSGKMVGEIIVGMFILLVMAVTIILLIPDESYIDIYKRR